MLALRPGTYLNSKLFWIINFLSTFIYILIMLNLDQISCMTTELLWYHCCQKFVALLKPILNGDGNIFFLAALPPPLLIRLISFA